MNETYFVLRATPFSLLGTVMSRNRTRAGARAKRKRAWCPLSSVNHVTDLLTKRVLARCKVDTSCNSYQSVTCYSSCASHSKLHRLTQRRFSLKHAQHNVCCHGPLVQCSVLIIENARPTCQKCPKRLCQSNASSV